MTFILFYDCAFSTQIAPLQSVTFLFPYVKAYPYITGHKWINWSVREHLMLNYCLQCLSCSTNNLHFLLIWKERSTRIRVLKFLGEFMDRRQPFSQRFHKLIWFLSMLHSQLLQSGWWLAKPLYAHYVIIIHWNAWHDRFCFFIWVHIMNKKKIALTKASHLLVCSLSPHRILF